MSYLLVCFVPLIFYSNTISNYLETYFSTEQAKESIVYGNVVAGLITEMQALSEKTTLSKVKNDVQIKCRDWNLNRILVINDQSFVIIDSIVSDDNLEGIMFSPPEVRIALNNQSKYSLDQAKTKMYAAVPILSEGVENNTVIGVVYIVSNVDVINSMLMQISQKLVLISILLALIVSVLVFFISQLLIDPLKNIIEVVKKMSEGHLHQRIMISGHDEFAEVGAAFNDMSKKLEQVELSRQEFVSNVSHELKTPLSSIKVLGESLLLQDDAPNEMYREFLQDITNEVDRMTAIVNELLSLVKLDQMEQPLNIKQVNMTKMIEEVMKRLHPFAKQKNISLNYEETKPFIINADEMKLSLAFSNLVENGIKYTPENGAVNVYVDGDHQNVFITIKDSGIGIDESEHDKVFTRFYRVDKTRDRETGGTGLGLAITHKVILLHDGSIKLLSKENEGSSFIVRLPINS